MEYILDKENLMTFELCAVIVMNLEIWSFSFEITAVLQNAVLFPRGRGGGGGGRGGTSTSLTVVLLQEQLYEYAIK